MYCYEGKTKKIKQKQKNIYIHGKNKILDKRTQLKEIRNERKRKSVCQFDGNNDNKYDHKYDYKYNFISP